jgi:hypothetical protein
MVSTTATSNAVLYYTKAGANATLAAVQIKGIAGKDYTFLAAGESTPLNVNLCKSLPVLLRVFGALPDACCSQTTIFPGTQSTPPRNRSYRPRT